MRETWMVGALALWLGVTGCDGDAALDAGVDAGAVMDAGGEDAGGEDAGTDAGVTDAGSPPPGDTCAAAVDVNARGTTMGEVTTIRGETYGASEDEAFCDPTPGFPTRLVGDVAYVYTPRADGTLLWELDRVTPTRFAVDLRTSCDASSSLACDLCGDSGCGARMDMTAGEPLYLVIAGVPTTGSPSGMGIFELTFTEIPFLEVGEVCGAPGSEACRPTLECQRDGTDDPVCGTCGDGVVSTELFHCDDGGTTAGDGCSASCEFESQGAGGATCDAAALLTLPPTRFGTGLVGGYAAGRGDVVAGSDYAAPCASDGGGPEAIYAFDLSTTSMVDVSTVGADAVAVVADAPSCGGVAQACMAGTGTINLNIPSLAAGRYLVIADRDTTTSAPDMTYDVEVFVQAP